MAELRTETTVEVITSTTYGANGVATTTTILTTYLKLFNTYQTWTAPLVDSSAANNPANTPSNSTPPSSTPPTVTTSLTTTTSAASSASITGSTSASLSTSSSTASRSRTLPSNTNSTITTSSLASTAASKSNGPSDISKGTLAGAAVGCAIGGLLLGLIAAWILLRRRRDSTGRATNIIPTEPDDKAGAAIAASHSSGTDDAQLEPFLLAATPDSEIMSELQALGDLISQHVENNYHSDPTNSRSALSQALVQLGFSQNAEAIAAICSKAQSRSTGLRHVISQTIFRSIDVRSRSRLSMFPAPLAAFLQSIPRGNDSTVSLALSQWRRSSTFLLHPNPIERSPLPVLKSAVAAQAVALATALNTFLCYFVDEASRDQQTSHLRDVILECTNLGYVLLSQPQDWQFVFETGRSDMIVVHPGLDKLGGRGGHGRRVVDPEAVQQDAR